MTLEPPVPAVRRGLAWLAPPANAGRWRWIFWVLPILLPLIGLYRGFAHHWRAIDAETFAPHEADVAQARGRYSPWALLVLAMCAMVLTLQEYVGDRGLFATWFPKAMAQKNGELYSFAWWAGWRVFGYVVLPMALILATPGQRLRDYNLSLRGFARHIWIYLAMFVVFFPVLYIASKTATFRHTYPFYRWANRSAFDLWSWEAMYIAQFFSLEFFFRGFLLQGLRKAFGANAIFVMIVPYCMIHFGKPGTETLGAIGAGLLLGTMAMRTKSIWGGVLIHVGVAVTMDVLALAGCPAAATARPCRSGW